MKLNEGMVAEYERRHNELWPEMIENIHAHGGKNYSIFFDPETNILFGYVEIDDPVKWALVGEAPINQKWWDFMADIMETYSDNSPVAVDLQSVFHLD